MQALVPTITEADILAQVVSPDEPDLAPEVARAILRLSFRPAAVQTMRELLDKNNRGVLAGEEQADMEKYLRVGQFLDLMQAKARISLQNSGLST